MSILNSVAHEGTERSIARAGATVTGSCVARAPIYRVATSWNRAAVDANLTLRLHSYPYVHTYRSTELYRRSIKPGDPRPKTIRTRHKTSSGAQEEGPRGLPHLLHDLAHLTLRPTGLLALVEVLGVLADVVEVAHEVDLGSEARMQMRTGRQRQFRSDHRIAAPSAEFSGLTLARSVSA